MYVQINLYHTNVTTLTVTAQHNTYAGRCVLKNSNGQLTSDMVIKY